MKKFDPAVRAQILYVAAVTLILSVLLQAVFLIIGYWDVTVLLGNLYGAAVAVFNFFLLALTVTRAVEKEEKEAGQMLRASQAGRLFLQFVLALVGALVPLFHTVAVLIPFLFPRVAVSLYPVISRRAANRKERREEDENA